MEIVAVPLEDADQRRGDTEERQALALGQLPETARIGEVGRTVEAHHRRATGVRANGDPRPHDPAHVGEPHDAIVGAQIGGEPGLQRDLHQQAAMGVHRALRSAGRARRVVHEDRRLAVDPRGGAVRAIGAVGQRGVIEVPMVFAADDDHVLNGRDGKRILDGGAHRYRLAAARRGVGRDHGLDGAVFETRGDRRRGEAREDRY